MFPALPPHPFRRRSRLSSRKAGRSLPGFRPWAERLEPRIQPSVTSTCFVERAYLDLLGRTVDPDGLAYWSGAVDQGQALDAVVRGIQTSTPEYAAHQVRGLFVRLLGREADPGGLAYWVSSARGGAALEEVEAGLLAGDEYFARAGGTNDAFLAAAYRDVLHREADAAGQAHYAGVLARSSRRAVALELLTSLEGRQGLVRQTYQAFLGRPAEEAGLTHWVMALQAQGLQELGLVARVVGSAEYYGLPCADDSNGAGGGGGAGDGGMAVAGGDVELREGLAFTVNARRTFTVPDQPYQLSFTYDLAFDGTVRQRVRDAFEAVLLGPDGRSLVHTVGPGRDGYFNLSEGQAAALGPATTLTGQTVRTDLSGLPAGTVATLLLRLVNDDGDAGTVVRVSNIRLVPGGSGEPPRAAQAAAALTAVQAPDFASLADVSASVAAEYGRTTFDEQTSVLQAALTLGNTGTYPVRGPLVAILDHLSDPSVAVLDADGVTPDGRPWFDVTGLASGGGLAPGERTAPRTVSFANPDRRPFTYELAVLARLNEGPQFTSHPVAETLPGVPYVYGAAAADPDGDPLTFTLLAGPAGMRVDPTTGRVAWTAAANDLGNQAVALQVDDGRGGRAEQHFTVAVTPPPPNRPPVISSSPAVEAAVGVPYLYPLEAADADGDPLSFRVTQGPAGLIVDPATGQVRWIPAAAQVGAANIVLEVADGRGGTVQQAYTAAVRPAPGNHAPHLVTTPAMLYLLPPSGSPPGAPYTYAARAVDADDDPLTYTLVAGPAGMTLDAATGMLAWSPAAADAGLHPVSVAVEDGRGGRDLQEFVLQVGAGTGSLAGLVIDADAQVSPGPVQLTVGARDAIFLAGRDDVNIPPLGVSDPNFPLTRAGGTGAGFALEEFPPSVPVQAGQVLTFEASGAVQHLSINPNAPPDGDPGGWTTSISSLAGVSGYQGPMGAFVGVFLGDGNPATATPPPTLDFIGGPGTTFASLAPALAQVFFIGDGYSAQNGPGPGRGGVPQEFTVPAGATRLFLGFADKSFQLSRPGHYDDNTGSVEVTVRTRGADVALVATDTQFAPADWSFAVALVQQSDANRQNNLSPPTGSAESRTTFGNPDAYRYGIHNVRVGDTITTTNFNTAVTYDPGVLGPLGAFDLDLDLWQLPPRPFFGAGSTLFQAAVQQGGQTFYATGNGHQQFSNQSWQHVPFAGLTAADFDTNSLAVFDPTQATGIHPDFSAAGAPLTFGYAMFNNAVGNPGQLALSEFGVDNWQVTAHRVAPSPGLAGWTVYLDANSNSRLDPGEPSGVSGAGGDYQFTGLPAGGYTVHEVVPAGWEAVAPPGGVHFVTLADGEAAVGRDFTNRAVPAPPAGPTFTSTPPDQATVGQLWRYDPVVTGTGLTFTLPAHPAGMAMDRASGTLVWVPTPEQGGPQTVVLSVRDGSGRTSLQSFQVESARAGAPPVIASSPVRQAVAGVPYRYQVQAQDAAGGPLSYALVSGPPGMAVDPASGQLSWTPASGQVGDWHVVVSAGQPGGGQGLQAFDLTVLATAPARPPRITSTPRTAVRLDRVYVYPLAVANPDAVPLSYVLDRAPAGMTVDGEGVLRWTPTPEQFGANPVTVRVEDGRGQADVQDFTVEVASRDVNLPPRILSTPPPAATLGRPYAYDLAAADPDGDPVLWTLLQGPAGLSLDPLRGTLRWTPSDGQLGPQAVVVQVQDALLAAATQAFTITVRAENVPPVITSAPPTTAAVAAIYAYSVQAVSPLGLPLSWSLAAAPAGMSIDPGSGLVTWTPAADQTGPQAVTVRAEDGQGGMAAQTYQVEVAAAAPNRPPVITSFPVLAASVAGPYRYVVQAADPEDEAVTYSLTEKPAGMSIDPVRGLAQWTPGAAQAGVQFVTVAAFDPHGAGAAQRFAVTVQANHPPAITSSPPDMVTAGRTYHYDVQAVDPEGDAVRYELAAGPAGLGLDALGRLTWATGPADIGTYAVVVRVTDERGAPAEQAFDVTVAADTQAPRVSVLAIADRVPVGSEASFTVQAADDVGVASLVLTVGGKPVALDARGTAVVRLDALGLVAVTATAVDAAGNQGSAAVTVRVIDPAATGGPTVEIASPAAEAVVTGPSPVTGTVTDPHLESYRVEFAPADRVGGDDPAHSTVPFALLAEGTTPVLNGTLATFDPTTLANDAYWVRVVARNINGDETARAVLVNVVGNLKLGEFRQEFTDLAVPLAGIPVEVTRVYDTHQADTPGDFGFGWQLGVQDPRIHATVPELPRDDPQSAILGLYAAAPYRDGTRVYLTGPDGRRVGFTFTPTVFQPLDYFPPIYHPAFTPDPGVYEQLSVDDVPLLKVGNSYRVFLFGFTYHPSAFTLTTKDGLAYRYDQAAGLQRITDRNGNTVTFSPDGITSSAGPAVQFLRDARGRIAEVIDPDGRALRYAYDAAGNLASVTDQAGLASSYGYETSPAHYLSEIIDPRGHPAARLDYDGQGRLRGTTDALGHAVGYAYDAGALVETITDPLGQPTTLTYDGRGNVVAARTALGAVTIYAYDARDNQVAVTDPRGFRTAAAYDAAGNPTSFTDPSGSTWSLTWNAFNKMTTTTDPLGHTITMLYDGRGNTTGMVNAAGLASRLDYDAAGRITAATDSAGATTTFAYQAGPNPTTVVNPDGSRRSVAYNVFGQPTLLTDERGNTARFTYDPDGRLLTRVDPQGGMTTYGYTADLLTSVTDPLGRVIRYEYDEADRRTRTIDPLGGVQQSAYDAAGHLLQATDPLGRTTTYAYDADGHVASVTDALGRTTTYAYDPSGNLTRQTDPLGHATSYEYDDQDQVVRQTDALGGATTFTYDVLGNQVSETDPLGRTSTSTFDVLGRVVARTDALGQVSTATFDSQGRQTSVTDAGGHTTHFTYDSRGRQIAMTDPAGATTTYAYDAVGNLVATTDPLGRTTTSVYDAQNRLTRTTDPLGGTTTRTYDAAGNLTAQTDALGHTATATYDALNRLIHTTDPLGGTTTRAYDAAGNLTAETDPLGHTTTVTYDGLDRPVRATDPAGGTTTLAYDAAGNLAASTDALGQTTIYAYDALNRLTRTTDPLGHTTTQSLDAAGRLVASTDPLGHTTTYTYDALDRLTRTTDPLGGTVTQTYDPAGRILSRTDPLGQTTTYAYDAAGRLTRTVDPTGAADTRTYDAAGNLTAETDPLGHTTTYTYDALGRLTRTTDALGRSLSTAYDAAGNRTSQTDPLGRTTTYAYDPLGRLTAETDPQGGVTRYAYDAAGNRTALTDPLGQTTRFAYDAADRLTSATDPLGHATTWTYDPAGQVLTRTDRDGRTRAFTYDAAGRLVEETWQTGSTTVATMTYGYDAAGDLLTAANAASDYSFTYDAAGRLATADDAGSPALPHVVLNYSYDAAGNVLAVADNLGVRVDSTFDAAGRLASRTWQGTGVAPAKVTLTRDAAGQRTEVRRFADAAGTVAVGRTTSLYDTAGRITALTHRGAADAVLADYAYTWDAAGQLTHETVRGQTSDDIDYSYDRTGQLTAADHAGSGSETFAYDAGGNRTAADMTVGAGHRVLDDGVFTYEYDAEGNVVARRETATGAVTRYSYDFLNRLVAVEERDALGTLVHQARYTYDVFGRRIGQVIDGTATATVYLPSGPPQVADGAAPAVSTDAPWADFTGGAVAARYLSGERVDEVFARWTPGSGTAWYLPDQLGSVRDVADAGGQVVDHLDYTAFGAVAVETDPAQGDRFKFAGREFDAVTGLYYFRARVYDPRQGRFLNEDPLRFDAGDANLYRYVGNGPANRLDPTGLVAVGVESATARVSGPTAAAPTLHSVNVTSTSITYFQEGVGQVTVTTNITGRSFLPILLSVIHHAFKAVVLLGAGKGVYDLAITFVHDSIGAQGTTEITVSGGSVTAPDPFNPTQTQPGHEDEPSHGTRTRTDRRDRCVDKISSPDRIYPLATVPTPDADGRPLQVDIWYTTTPSNGADLSRYYPAYWRDLTDAHPQVAGTGTVYNAYKGYDRGHVLAQSLGGPPDLDRNIVPLCPITNQVQMRTLEGRVKKATGPGKCVHYQVDVIYDRVFVLPPDPLERDYITPGQQWVPEKQAQDSANSRVPERVQLTSYQVTDQGGIIWIVPTQGLSNSCRP